MPRHVLYNAAVVQYYTCPYRYLPIYLHAHIKKCYVIIGTLKNKMPTIIIIWYFYAITILKMVSNLFYFCSVLLSLCPKI